jgi:hypothetical protein
VIPDPTIEDPEAWLVYFERHGPVVEITFTYRRRLPGGESIRFDEGPTTLDLANDADDRLVMDGFLAALPEGELLSCATLTTRPFLRFWEPALQWRHEPADHDKELVRAAFQGQMGRGDSTPEFVFVGGDEAAHTSPAVRRAVDALRTGRWTFHPDPVAALRDALTAYEGVAWSRETETGLFLRDRPGLLDDTRARVAEVAARYGVILASDDVE